MSGLSVLLIEPVWNRNVGTILIPASLNAAFNRTSLESKHDLTHEELDYQIAFNRTSLESKRNPVFAFVI